MSEAVNKFGSLSPQLQTFYQAMQANPTTTVSESESVTLAFGQMLITSCIDRNSIC